MSLRWCEEVDDVGGEGERWIGSGLKFCFPGRWESGKNFEEVFAKREVSVEFGL